MDELDNVYNILYQSTYCINAYSKELYLIFLKPLIQRYLADPIDYQIYVSVPDEYLSIYQQIWPSHPKLHYLEDDIIPTSVLSQASSPNIIYIYHRTTKPSVQQQLTLIEFLKNHPSLKYIMVNKTSNLLPYVYYHLFQYCIHFEKTRSRWGRLHVGELIRRDIARKINRRYHSQNEKKKTITTSMSLYDYFLFHDIMMDKTTIFRFNKKIYISKKERPIIQAPASPTVQVQYIYSTTHPGSNSLVMPDGSRENFQNVVNKYIDVIEV